MFKDRYENGKLTVSDLKKICSVKQSRGDQKHDYKHFLAEKDPYR